MEIENTDEMRQALEWYAEMAKQMQRATLHLDNGVMLGLMRQLALDGGEKARKALAKVTTENHGQATLRP